MSLIDRRYLHRGSDAAVWVLGVGMSLLLLYYAQSFYVLRVRHAVLVLGLSMAIYYLEQFRAIYEVGADTDEVDTTATDVEDSGSRLSNYVSSVSPNVVDATGSVGSTVTAVRDKLRPWLLLTFATLSLLTMLYIHLDFKRLHVEAPIAGYNQADIIVGAIIIFLVTDVTARAFGNILASVVVVAFLYGYFGPSLPGLFYHSGLDIREMVRLVSISLSGIYGFILQIGATWVGIFLLLAGFAKSYDILDFLVEASQEAGKLTKTGIVHAAVLASLAFGSITGSGAANTATTGNFTIPMMKKQGVDNAYAGAIETISSIGGQLVPPIMGVAAFIMADLIGVPYLRIVQAGLIPAFLFYFSIVVAVQLLVFKHGWTSTRSRDVDWRVFLEFAWYVVPFGILIYLLAVLRFSPLIAGYYTVLALVAVSILKAIAESVYAGVERRETDIGTVASRGAAGVKDGIVMTLDGLRQGAIDMAPLIAVLGSIGVLIEMFTATGFAQRLSTVMVAVAGGSLLLLLLLSMFISLLFGMGMPAPAAYILTASLAATAMIRFGVQDIAAHFFVFYFALYASFTPPVGPSTIIAARLADAPFAETAKQSVRIATPGFLIPFVFIANQSLIYWQSPVTLLMFLSVIVAVVGICMAMYAFDGRNHLSAVVRGLYFALAILIMFGTYAGIFESYYYQVGAAAVLLGIISLNYVAFDRIQATATGGILNR